MTPEMESRMRHSKWPLILSAVILFCAALGFILNSRIQNAPDEPAVLAEPEVPVVQVPDEWLYVTTNSVLLFPVVSDKCRIKHALMQVHKGTKVLVIARQGEWVEIEQNDQTALHTHGCIHESMLEKRND
jgi:hypothetical protein